MLRPISRLSERGGGERGEKGRRQVTAVRISLPASFELFDDFAERSSGKDVGGPHMTLGQQPGSLIARHQVIRTRRVGQRQQPSIIWVHSLVAARRSTQDRGSLEIVQHTADTMRLKNSPKFWVSAGSPQLIELDAGGHQLETPLAPCFGSCAADHVGR